MLALSCYPPGQIHAKHNRRKRLPVAADRQLRRSERKSGHAPADCTRAMAKAWQRDERKTSPCSETTALREPVDTLGQANRAGACARVREPGAIDHARQGTPVPR